MHEARSLPTHTTISPLTCPLRTSSSIHTHRSTTHTTERFGRGAEETMSEGTPQPLGTIKSEKRVNPQISCREGNREQHRANEIVHQHDQSLEWFGRVGGHELPHRLGMARARTCRAMHKPLQRNLARYRELAPPIPLIRNFPTARHLEPVGLIRLRQGAHLAPPGGQGPHPRVGGGGGRGSLPPGWQADARSTLVPKHAETARAGFHDRGDDVSTGVSKARAWAATTIRVGPRPEPIGGPALASFSSFPRGTCSLSVSRPYLALDGIYRPIRAAFQTTRLVDSASWCDRVRARTGLSPSPAPLSRGTWARSVAEDASPDYNSDAEGDRFSSWAIPGSLAVTKGILAGFDNDPSAGSPTETLLRLLLPLNDKVQWTSRDVAGSRTAHVAAIRTLQPDHSIGRSDGRAGGTTRPIKARSASPAVGTSRPVLTVRRTGRPTPRSNYELFNCNNLNIRYWSWNYRGCWHQTCPPMDPR
ncbi:hypothetical protein V6N13_053352 [Hibiscus sabdariffa]